MKRKNSSNKKINNQSKNDKSKLLQYKESPPKFEKNQIDNNQEDSLTKLEKERDRLLSQRKEISKTLKEVNKRQNYIGTKTQTFDFNDDLNDLSYSDYKIEENDENRPRSNYTNFSYNSISDKKYTNKDFEELGLFRDPRRDTQKSIRLNLDFKTGLDRQVNEKERIRNYQKNKEIEAEFNLEKKIELDQKKLSYRLKKEKRNDRQVSQIRHLIGYPYKIQKPEDNIKKEKKSKIEEIPYEGIIMQRIVDGMIKSTNERIVRDEYDKEEDDKLLEIYEMEEHNKEMDFFMENSKFLKDNGIEYDYDRRAAILGGIDTVKSVSNYKNGIETLNALQKKLGESKKLNALDILPKQTRNRLSEFPQKRVGLDYEHAIDWKYNFTENNPKVFFRNLISKSEIFTKKLASGY